jgi:hypothetical protein
MKNLLSVCLFLFLVACLTGAIVLVADGLESKPAPATASVQGRLLRDWLEDLRDSDPRVRQEALDALDAMGPSNSLAVPELVQALKDDSSWVRLGAIRALGRIGPAAREALPALDKLQRDHPETDANELLQARARIGGQHSTSPSAPGLVRPPKFPVEISEPGTENN